MPARQAKACATSRLVRYADGGVVGVDGEEPGGAGGFHPHGDRASGLGGDGELYGGAVERRGPARVRPARSPATRGASATPERRPAGECPSVAAPTLR